MGDDIKAYLEALPHFEFWVGVGIGVGLLLAVELLFELVEDLFYDK